MPAFTVADPRCAIELSSNSQLPRRLCGDGSRRVDVAVSVATGMPGWLAPINHSSVSACLNDLIGASDRPMQT